MKGIFICALILNFCSCINDPNLESKKYSEPIRVSITDAKTPVSPAFVLWDIFPICIDYSESHFDEKMDKSYFEYTLSDKNYLKGKIKKSKQFIKNKLFSNSNFVPVTNIYTGDTVATEPTTEYLLLNDFYLCDTVINANKFCGIIFEKIEANGSIKYFCTFNTKRKLISKIQIAFYTISGSNTTKDGGKRPYRTREEACFENDMSILISNEKSKKKYLINEDGTIVLEKINP